MGLRIKTNGSALEANTHLRLNANKEGKEFAKLASGKRINRASDDAAGLAMAKGMEAQIRSMNQARRNGNDAIAMVQVAEGALNESHNILTRLRELSIQAASDTVGNRERGYLNREYQNLVEEVDRIANSTEFSGLKLINGESETGVMDFHVGPNAGDLNRISFDSNEVNATISELGIDGTAIEDKDGANDSLAEIDTAIHTVSGYRANLGATQSRLNSAVSNLDVQVLNQDLAKSRIEDADIAETSARLATSQVIKNSAIATLAQANNIPASALRLVG